MTLWQIHFYYWITTHYSVVQQNVECLWMMLCVTDEPEVQCVTQWHTNVRNTWQVMQTSVGLLGLPKIIGGLLISLALPIHLSAHRSSRRVKSWRPTLWPIAWDATTMNTINLLPEETIQYVGNKGCYCSWQRSINSADSKLFDSLASLTFGCSVCLHREIRRRISVALLTCSRRPSADGAAVTAT